MRGMSFVSNAAGVRQVDLWPPSLDPPSSLVSEAEGRLVFSGLPCFSSFKLLRARGKEAQSDVRRNGPGGKDLDARGA